MHPMKPACPEVLFGLNLLLGPSQAESSFPALVAPVQAAPLACRPSPWSLAVHMAAHPEVSFKPFILPLLLQDTGDSSSEGLLKEWPVFCIFNDLCCRQ